MHTELSTIFNAQIPGKRAAISTGPYTHLDHLGPLCALLGMPLLVTEENTYRLAQKFYPQVEAVLKEHRELTLDFLASSFDVLFECGKFWAIELLPLFKLFYQKQMRIVFCPHGNSDKGHSLSSSVPQDISLIYGQQMVDQLKKTGAFDQIGTPIITGNIRYPFYSHHRRFYDELADQHVFSRLDPRKKTILYAPTWQDRENTSSFFQACVTLIDQLSPAYNLIVKLHPLLEEEHPAATCHILAKYASFPHLVLLTEFPPIYPLLARSDLYLGDYSSIGYDFLAFDRPLFFLNPDGKSLFLHRCGIEIPKEAISELRPFLARHLEHNQIHYSPIRRQAYRYAFEETTNLEQVGLRHG